MGKKELCKPILALFFISLGGLLLHLRFHKVVGEGAEAEYWIPTIFGLVTTFVLPFMFYSRGGAKAAYLITWLAVVIGTITMAAYSIEHMSGPVTFGSIILGSTLADILILFAKIPLAQMILQWWKNHPEATETPAEEPAVGA